MYFIPICDEVNNPEPSFYELEPDSNCKELINTMFFQLAKLNDCNFTIYKKQELNQQVVRILQIQGYLLFQWCVIRMRLECPLGFKKLHFSCSKVMPWNFFVTETDVKLYLKEPRFLWRFSTNNYGYFFDILSKGSKKILNKLNISCDYLLTYNHDKSDVVPVIKQYSFKQKVQKLYKSSAKESVSYYCKKVKYENLLKGANLYQIYKYEENEWCYTTEYIDIKDVHQLSNYHEFLNYLIFGVSVSS